jgi:hypothetical protein
MTDKGAYSASPHRDYVPIEHFSQLMLEDSPARGCTRECVANNIQLQPKYALSFLESNAVRRL